MGGYRHVLKKSLNKLTWKFCVFMINSVLNSEYVNDQDDSFNIVLKYDAHHSIIVGLRNITLC